MATSLVIEEERGTVPASSTRTTATSPVCSPRCPRPRQASRPGRPPGCASSPARPKGRCGQQRDLGLHTWECSHPPPRAEQFCGGQGSCGSSSPNGPGALTAMSSLARSCPAEHRATMVTGSPQSTWWRAGGTADARSSWRLHSGSAAISCPRTPCVETSRARRPTPVRSRRLLPTRARRRSSGRGLRTRGSR